MLGHSSGRVNGAMRWEVSAAILSSGAASVLLHLLPTRLAEENVNDTMAEKPVAMEGEEGLMTVCSAVSRVLAVWMVLIRCRQERG